jgi:hypothetical protein
MCRQVKKDPSCASDRPHSLVCPPGGSELLLCTDQLVPIYDSQIVSVVYQECLINVNSPFPQSNLLVMMLLLTKLSADAAHCYNEKSIHCGAQGFMGG